MADTRTIHSRVAEPGNAKYKKRQVFHYTIGSIASVHANSLLFCDSLCSRPFARVTEAFRMNVYGLPDWKHTSLSLLQCTAPANASLLQKVLKTYSRVSPTPGSYDRTRAPCCRTTTIDSLEERDRSAQQSMRLNGQAGTHRLLHQTKGKIMRVCSVQIWPVQDPPRGGAQLRLRVPHAHQRNSFILATERESSSCSSERQ